MIADGLVELNHPSVAPCKIVCNEVVKSFCKFLYLSNGCLSSFVCNDGIITLRTLGVHAKKCHVGEIIAYYRQDHCLFYKSILLGTYLLASHVEFSCPCGGMRRLLILYVRNSMYNNIKLHIPII